jgi:hypothetical protein
MVLFQHRYHGMIGAAIAGARRAVFRRHLELLKRLIAVRQSRRPQAAFEEIED